MSLTLYATYAILTGSVSGCRLGKSMDTLFFLDNLAAAGQLLHVSLSG